MILGRESFALQRSQRKGSQTPAGHGPTGAEGTAFGGGAATPLLIGGWRSQVADHQFAAGGGRNGKMGLTCAHALFPPAIF